MTEYADYLAQLRSTHPELARELEDVRTLEKLLDWMRARGQDFAALDMVAQDEFCHDLLVPVTPGQLWLTFSMT
jgi:hypothetical protein